MAAPLHHDGLPPPSGYLQNEVEGEMVFRAVRAVMTLALVMGPLRW